jgi:hypothetical protein
MTGKTMYFYTTATEAKLQELLNKEIKRVFEIFFGVVSRLRPRQKYSDARLALQKINGAIIFKKSLREIRKRKQCRLWENIVSKIITNIRAEILLKVRWEVCSHKIGYFIKRQVQQSDYNRKLFFMNKILLFLRRRIEQIRYISEYNIYKNSRDEELNELKAHLLNEKQKEFNNELLKQKELESRLLKQKESELKELESRLLKQNESELKELESRLLKQKESEIQKYRESLRQEKNRVEEQRWLLLQQIETEFTTVKESEMKKSYDEEFSEYKRIIGEKMIKLQIENMELKEENTRLISSIKAKKWTFLDRFFTNHE